MRLGGLVPCSFVDWPGRLAAAVFTQGCNLRCRYCHNPALVGAGGGAGADPLAPGDVLELLAKRRGKLDGVVISGGEPTLQADLAEFLGRIRALGFAVKLDTNGTRPEVVRELLAAGLVDYLAIDLKATPADAAWVCGEAEQPLQARACLEAALSLGVDHELRTTVFAPLFTAEKLAELSEHARGAKRWFLQRFRPGGHLDPEAPLEAPGAIAWPATLAVQPGLRGLARTV